jgi:murein DD-endopeptidase MepM/ murein hydrolase activator NlpD
MVRVAALTITLAAAWALVEAQSPLTVRTTVFDRAAYPGDVVRLDITCRCDSERATATVFARDVPLVRTPDGWRGWIGIDLETKPATYTITVTAHSPGTAAIVAKNALAVRAKRFPVRRLTVAPQFVEPPPGELQRIERESAMLRTIFEHVSLPQQWQGAFLTPLQEQPSGNFGSRSVFNGQARSPHSGVDFGARIGTPVAAPAGGVVSLAEPLYFTGNTVVLDHGLGVYSLLAHLSEFKTMKGAVVSRGDIVGLVGDTGRVTAPHLHWSVRLNNARVDPLSLIAATKN